MALRLKNLFGKLKKTSKSSQSEANANERHLGFPQEVARIPVEKKGWRRLIPGGNYKKVLRWFGTNKTQVPFLKSSFVEQNERMMNVREKVLLEAKLPKETIQRALHLFRLRKAARVAASTTGYCTRNTTLEFINFLEKEMRERVKHAQLYPGTFDKEQKEWLELLGNVLKAIKKVSKTSNVKERIKMAKTRKNDFMVLRMEGAEATELALNPSAKKISRIVDLGGFVAGVLQISIDERLKKVVGQDYYDEIKKKEIAESKRRQMD